ncbi:MAG: COX15/CtaA family protein [Deltaproteobacteria bacterium]|nr:COX15/CtaA family protein [Deltaproteobacteria bacterium]
MNADTSKSRKLFMALGITVASAYILMVVGTFVTSTGSGLGCPDWPLCHGTVAPPLEMQVWFEWGHRLLGALTGFLILYSTFVIWKSYKGTSLYLMLGVGGLLVAAVLFGGLIVHTEAPLLESFTHVLIISSHLLIAVVVFTLLIFVLRSVGPLGEDAGTGAYALIFTAIFMQVVVGIFVRYSSATLACPDFPLCHGSIIPDIMSQKIVLQVLHRAVAFSVLALAVVLFVRSVRKEKSANARGLLFTIALIVLQGAFGAAVVFSSMFLPFIILHGATGFFLMGWLAYKSAPYFLMRSGAAAEQRSHIVGAEAL